MSGSPSFARKFATMAIGNVMEWFDFSSFGALIDIISINFFPDEQSQTTKLLNTLGLFGIAFLMRPMGGILLGWIGDTMGRKLALEISIGMMLFPSFLIGCLPTFQQVGWVSPALLLLLRCMQGLAAGGEIVGAFVYTLEATGGINMGLWGGACKATGNFGTAMGIGLIAVLRAALSKQAMNSWGWRIPFWTGLLLGIIGLTARRSLKADEVIVDSEHQAKPTLSSILSTIWKEVLFVTLTASFWGTSYYTSFVWMAYFMEDDKLSGGVKEVWFIIFSANLLLVILLPVGGYLGDLFGIQFEDDEKGTAFALRLAILMMITMVIPAFLLIMSRSLWMVVLGMLLLALPVALFGGNLPVFMARSFPIAVRYTGMGVAYNAATAIFSSTASIIQTALILELPDSKKHGLIIADPRLRPAYFVIVIAMVSLTGIWVSQNLKSSIKRTIVSSEDGPESEFEERAQSQKLKEESSDRECLLLIELQPASPYHEQATK